ncbi:hypothetical protein HNV12_02410 [Methanococcoides sp. SA1]|nr:hypothetical protein [Methanococcoides sp. SA1]
MRVGIILLVVVLLSGICLGETFVQDIIIDEEFEGIEGFGKVEFSVGNERDITVSQNSFSIKSSNSLDGNLIKSFSSESISIRSVYEKIDTGFFNADDMAIKQTYVINNREGTDKDVTLRVRYKIDSDYINWNGTNYSVQEKAIYFEAFETEVLLDIGKSSWAGHTLYFGNSYYDFKDVIGLDYRVSVYLEEEVRYIELEVNGKVEAFGEFVVDPIIGWHGKEKYRWNKGITPALYAADLGYGEEGEMSIIGGREEGGLVIYKDEDIVVMDINSNTIIDSVFAADLDSDGDMDVIFSDGDNNIVGWYENNGSGFFIDKHIISRDLDGPYSVFAADLDSDGDIDVLSSGAYNNITVWYENDGSGNFNPHVIADSVDEVLSVSAADLDSDGDMDILLPGALSEEMTWYENDGTGNFNFHTIDTFSNGVWDIHSEDIDSDGDIDILSANSLNSKVMWYENDGYGNFDSHVIANSVYGVISVFAKDLDSDGDMDILSASMIDDKVIWHENDGFENFDSRTLNNIADGANSVFAEDWDMDGHVEIFSVSGNDGSLWIYEPIFSGEDKYCRGDINIIVEDSDGNPMKGLYSYLNGNSSRVTNTNGFVQYYLPIAFCERAYEIEVKCSDQRTLCNSSFASIDYHMDVDTLTFTCDMCRTGKDLWINKKELTFEDAESGKTKVSINLHSLNLTKQAEVSLIKNCNGEKTLSQKQTIPILPGETKTISFTDNLEGCQKIDIITEYFREEDFSKNNIIQDFPIIEPLKIYLEVDSGYSEVNEAIKEFLEDYTQVVSTRAESNLDVYIGKKICQRSDDCQNYLSNNLITFQGEREGLPYNGLIIKDIGEIYVLGNEIDGTIAAVRKLIDERENYLNKRTAWLEMPDIYLDTQNLEALSIYDYLHTEENLNNYRKNNEAFASTVSKVLTKDVFNLDVKRVTTSTGIPLRLKNLASEFSQNFKNFVGEKPVVMSGGIFSNLETWEDGGDGLAIDLVESGRDVWEIEMTGGITTECDECEDYTYDDLVDSYWPSLVAAVQHYTGAVSLDYVGHSNGCRVALSSLAKYQKTGKNDVGSVENVSIDLEGSVSNPVVETFIGVACPAELNGGTFLSALTREVIIGSESYLLGSKVFDQLKGGHVSIDDYTGALFLAGLDDSNPDLGKYSVFFVSKIFGDEKISRSLMKYYNDLSMSEESDFDLDGLEIEKLRLYYGNVWKSGQDGVVPVEDMDVIANQIKNEDEFTKDYPGFLSSVNHVSVKNKKNVKDKILEDLK